MNRKTFNKDNPFLHIITFIYFSFQYSTWSLIWLGWNVFVICLYLEVGVLSRVSIGFSI